MQGRAERHATPSPRRGEGWGEGFGSNLDRAPSRTVQHADRNVRRAGQSGARLPLPGGERDGMRGFGRNMRREIVSSRTSTARRLRRNQTDAERILWLRLRDRRLNGLKFRRQVPIDRYVVDFFCPDAHLVIE